MDYSLWSWMATKVQQRYREWCQKRGPIWPGMWHDMDEGWSRRRVRSQLWPLGLPKNFYRFMTYLWPRSPSEMIWRTLWSAFWPALEFEFLSNCPKTRPFFNSQAKRISKADHENCKIWVVKWNWQKSFKNALTFFEKNQSLNFQENSVLFLVI